MKLNFNNLSLKYKITLMIMVVFFIIFVTLSMFLYIFSKKEFYASALNDVKMIGYIIGENNVAALVFDDSDFAKRSLKPLKSIPELVNVDIVKKDGKELAGYSASEEDTLNLKEYYHYPTDTIVETGGYFISIHVVEFKKERVGKIILAYSKSTFLNRFKRFVIYEFGIFFLIFLVAFVFILILQNFITKPVLKLTTTMKQVMDKNDFSLRLKAKGEDEVGEMIMVFNHMIQHIQTQNKELVKAREEALELAKAKEQFLAHMSHELRTPLNAIYGFMMLLEKTPLEKEQKTYVDYVKSSLENLTGIINDVLDFSKIAAGKLLIKKNPFNLPQFLEEIIHLLKPKLEEKKIDLLGEWDETELPRFVMGDKLRLSQILINLMGNAIKFTSVGYVKLIVKKEAVKGNEVTLYFAIKDTGIGIAPEKAAHIFDEFQQASAEVQVEYGGTGLGLSISKQLVELQGGKLQLKSEPQKGSVFYFSLKFEIVEHIEEKIVETQRDTAVDVSKLNLLVAEDNKLNQILIKKVLKNNNINCDIANNGREAVELLEKNDYDIIFMDINMPEMDGYQATEYIRTEMNDEQKSGIPIIALSAAVTESERNKAEEVGMNYFLAKPFKEEDIINLLNKIFTK